jgi:uncharacterized damage-inducible protein DinB
LTAGAGWARNLIAYNGWANNLVLDAAAGLDKGQFKQNAGGSWGSVRGHLVHILDAEVWWHSVLAAGCEAGSTNPVTASAHTATT